MNEQISKECFIKKNNCSRMVKAYIFVQTSSGNLSNILTDAEKLQNVVSVAVISGDWDVLVKTRVKNLEQLMDITEKIRCITGIQQVATHVVEKEIIK